MAVFSQRFNVLLSREDSPFVPFHANLWCILRKNVTLIYILFPQSLLQVSDIENSSIRVSVHYHHHLSLL